MVGVPEHTKDARDGSLCAYVISWGHINALPSIISRIHFYSKQKRLVVHQV